MKLFALRDNNSMDGRAGYSEVWQAGDAREAAILALAYINARKLDTQWHRRSILVSVVELVFPEGAGRLEAASHTYYFTRGNEVVVEVTETRANQIVED